MRSEHFELPDNECPRLKRSESLSVQTLLAGLSNLKYAQEELKSRLEIIPDGTQRMIDMLDEYESLLNDVCGTISDKQRQYLQNVANDMEIRMVPKLSTKKTTLVLPDNEARELVDAAQAKCVDCFKDESESRFCGLRSLLERILPLESFETYSCPYSRAQWEDDEDA